MKALLWLRNQTIIANKNLLVQVLMPYGLLIIYKNFMNLGKDKGLDLMFLCLSTAIAMSVGSTVSTIMLKRKKSKNLKTLLLSGVRPYEYLISVLVHPVVITIFKYDFVPLYCRRRYFLKIYFRVWFSSHVDSYGCYSHQSMYCCYFFDTIKSSN